MNFKNTFLLLLFMSFGTCLAQKLELGKVSVQELQEKAHPKDSTAVAAILFKKGEIYFEYNKEKGFEMKTKVCVRIKIYKKGGYDWANQVVRYYSGAGIDERLTFSDAITYNLVEGKIEKTKLKSDGQFLEKVNPYWSRKKIALPNVKVGSVIEYSYLIVSDNFTQMIDWDFQHTIPVNHSELVTRIPEYYIYKTSQKGFIFPKVSKEINRKTVHFNEVQRMGVYTVSQKISNSELQYNENQTTYLAQNLPALKEEAFVNNIDNYTASVVHELESIQFPEQPYKFYATDWESVTKKIYESERFGNELKKTGYFEEDLKKILEGKSNPEDKISAVYNFVKSKVKWNEMYGYYCNDGVKKAYKDGTGNVAEINLMLTAHAAAGSSKCQSNPDQY